MIDHPLRTVKDYEILQHNLQKKQEDLKNGNGDTKRLLKEIHEIEMLLHHPERIQKFEGGHD